ncbi:MAG: YdcF family protein [Mariprofundaceae bacterium]|nr:YdcF family protein [Mariprofundaceae bacterium]
MTLFISKSIAFLLLPPGGIILLALLGLLFWKYRGGKELIIASMVLLWVLSTEPMRDALISPLESHFSVLKINPPMIHQLRQEHVAIVLLGGGMYKQAPEFGNRNALKGHALMRTLYAAQVAKKTGLDIYSTGGRGMGGRDEPESRVMNRWLIKFGVDPKHVFREDTAKTTAENAANIKRILQKKNINKIILVTTAWHMPRSVHVFKSQGLDVIPAPCAYVAKLGDYNILSFLPQAHVLADSSDALHEYLGILWYQWVYADHPE